MGIVVSIIASQRFVPDAGCVVSSLVAHASREHKQQVLDASLSVLQSRRLTGRPRTSSRSASTLAAAELTRSSCVADALLRPEYSRLSGLCGPMVGISPEVDEAMAGRVIFLDLGDTLGESPSRLLLLLPKRVDRGRLACRRILGVGDSNWGIGAVCGAVPCEGGKCRLSWEERKWLAGISSSESKNISVS